MGLALSSQKTCGGEGAVRAWVRSVCVVRVRSSLRGVVARRACVL